MPRAIEQLDTRAPRHTTGRRYPGWQGRLIPWLICALLLNGCVLPPLTDRTVSRALPAAEARATGLGRTLAPSVDAHPGLSGIYPLPDPLAAFAARALLAEAAERTLDIQCYIWHGDTTGMLLFKAVHAAAERGVRVRLLLDDNGIPGLDDELAALDTHPNIDVRLFNPFLVRTPKFIGYLTQFPQANRRMHNKSFTVDNQATIIGGRNVGDEYFGATRDMLFTDLDVLAVGPVVNDVSADFDRYWISGSAYPASSILPVAEPARRRELMARIALLEREDVATTYLDAQRQSHFVQDMLEGSLALEWAETHMVSDDPAKGLGLAEKDALLVTQLADILGHPQTNLELISPYFVPTEAGTEAFVALARQGVKVRILTNSLEATDVAAVHAGYAKRRKDLLEGGIRLYEMRRTPGSQHRNASAGPFGSSGSSLHAKTFAVDDARVFIGSFNFDPRSAHLNTELGFIIDSPRLARQMDRLFNERVPLEAYEVQLDANADLVWLERHEGEVLRHTREPGASLWRRAMVWLLSHLPIEWML